MPGFELKMPKLGESVTEGTIGKWLKQPGEKVNKYDLLVEVQTARVNTEIPSPVAGTLKEVRVEEGQTVPIGTLLATFETADGDVAAASPASAPPPAAAASPRPPPTPPPGPPPGGVVFASAAADASSSERLACSRARDIDSLNVAGSTAFVGAGCVRSFPAIISHVRVGAAAVSARAVRVHPFNVGLVFLVHRIDGDRGARGSLRCEGDAGSAEARGGE